MPNGKPSDLIFTLFGDYFLHRDAPVWVGSLITFLGRLGLSEGATRTTLSRMVQRGWLASERVGRFGYYDLTDRARRMLEEGEHRIYHPDWDRPWDDRWFLLAYSIPEDQRTLREDLRSRLAWLGFGSLGNGLWISPRDHSEQVSAMASELGLENQIVAFQADGPTVGDRDELVASCWDLPGLNADYEVFIGHWAPVFLRCRDAVAAESLAPEEAFVLRFDLIHEYRDLPLRDPFLPRALLPRDWGGECAAHLFQHCHDLLAPVADRYVEEVVSAVPAAAGASTSG